MLEHNVWIRVNGDIKTILIQNNEAHELNVNDIYLECSKILGCAPSKFKLLYRGKYLKLDHTRNYENSKIENNATLDLIVPMVGGSVLDDLISSIQQIGEFFAILPRIMMWSISLTIWIWQFTIWFFIDFCNPVNLANDFIGGIMKITRLIFAVISDAIFGLAKYVFNMVLSPIFSGFWGWDNVLTPEEKAAILEKTQNEIGASGTTIEGDLKVFDPPDGKVPFTVILATILMPPMGLFMELGLSGWVNIVICGILTLAFYFPGLIYALMMIYS